MPFEGTAVSQRINKSCHSVDLGPVTRRAVNYQKGTETRVQVVSLCYIILSKYEVVKCGIRNADQCCLLFPITAVGGACGRARVVLRIILGHPRGGRTNLPKGKIL